MQTKLDRSHLEVSRRLLPVRVIGALVEHGAGDHGQGEEAETTTDTLHTAGVWGHVIQKERDGTDGRGGEGDCILAEFKII